MSRRKKPDPFALLRPTAEGMWAAFDAVQNSSYSQLLEIEKQIAAVTTRNCWFAIYDAAQYLTPIITHEKERRLRNAMNATATWQP